MNTCRQVKLFFYRRETVISAADSNLFSNVSAAVTMCWTGGCTYLSVITSVVCPRYLWMVLKSIPSSNIWVAPVRRKSVIQK